VTPLPAMSELRRSDAACSVLLDITPDLAPFEGHFPGTPILPAVAQIDWAIRLARDWFELPAHFRGLRVLKFLHIVQPPAALTLELIRSPGGRSVSFSYVRAGTACSSGRIEFADHEFVDHPPGPDRPVL
jgi:3-hydroxymyristoyl/3-hydroxydecanoyl-(acyl carrier protein) dehydratase